MTRPSATLDTRPHSSASSLARADHDVLVRYGFIGIVLAGIILRLGVILFSGGGVQTAWGGTGDAPAYILLAHNLISGLGYTFAGQPTAYHPPLYPIMLAISMKVFGTHALVAIRWLQFLEGLLVVFLCADVAGRIFGEQARKATVVITLFFPTLVFMTGEILTEATATLFSVLFLYFLVRYIREPSLRLLIILSAIVGLSTLVRFNMALLGLLLLGVAVLGNEGRFRWRSAALVIFVSGMIVSPWLIRNFNDFGTLVLSTEGGPTAVMGVLAPQGRALPGDSERLTQALGWLPPTDLETNDASRNRLPSEAVLNRQAWHVCLDLWRQTGWALIPLTLAKLSYFWLSTDQLLSTASFRVTVRAVRGAGVLLYWLLAGLAVAGWFRLRHRRPELAAIFLFYFLLVTVLHLPFNMNTRLRMPFIDSWLAVLAGAGCAAVIDRFAGRRRALSTPLAPV